MKGGEYQTHHGHGPWVLARGWVRCPCGALLFMAAEWDPEGQQAAAEALDRAALRAAAVQALHGACRPPVGPDTVGAGADG